MKKAKFLCLALENKVELYNFTYQEIVNAFPVKLVAQCLLAKLVLSVIFYGDLFLN